MHGSRPNSDNNGPGGFRRMKIRIELTPEEVDKAIRNYIRQAGIAIPEGGDVTQTFFGRQIEAGATYEVEIE